MTKPSERREVLRKGVSKKPAGKLAASGWVGSLILVLAVVLAYLPVWHAGFIWDDHAYITANPCLHGWRGLRDIWTTRAADISPLTFTTFWVEHALWGLTPLPYHLVNIFLHGACAVLLWRILRILRAPGAWLGAALWALHPVQVESVAWITETKNTQSGLFFLLSVLCFLQWLDVRYRFGSAARGCSYALTFVFAALAMASKSSTVILPVVLCLCAWWTEGRWSWRDVRCVGPILLLSIAASALSIWTQGLALSATPDIHLPRTYPERLVTAGDAIWFYLGKLVWPHPLITNYPQWKINAGGWFSYLPLLAGLAALFILWRKRQTWARPWFFVFAYFLAALLPVLGLVDNTIFRYAPVFDHFQYLASMGPLALIGAGMTRLSRSALPGKAWRQGALSVSVLLVLGTLSWQRSEVYHDEETFWTDAVAKNPDGWLGRDDLGSALLLRGQVEGARAQYELALVSNPNYPVAHNNLGILLLRQGKLEEAMTHLEAAVALDPNYAEAHSNLGNALLASGQVDAAIRQYEKALALNPGFDFVYFDLGNALFAKGQIDQAIEQYEKAMAINADYAEAHSNLGNAFLAKRQLNEAIAQYQKALSIRPDYAEAHNNLGVAFLRTARFEEAIIEFQEAAQLAPDYPNVQSNLATARMLSRRYRPGR